MRQWQEGSWADGDRCCSRRAQRGGEVDGGLEAVPKRVSQRVHHGLELRITEWTDTMRSQGLARLCSALCCFHAASLGRVFPSQQGPQASQGAA